MRRMGTRGFNMKRYYALAMARWHVGFDGRWQESFHDREDAVEWAREVAETGRTVDVAQRRFVIGRKLVDVFPESERAQREAVWSAAAMAWLGSGSYAGSGGDFGGGGGGDGGGGGC
jgi:uncharacterized membrane protein YgcG